MTTFAATKLSTAQDWCVYAVIEGVGKYLDATSGAANNGDTRYRFCSSSPAFAVDTTLWLPFLSDVPDLLSERVDPFGGLPEAGSLELSIVDIDNLVTDTIQPNAWPTTVLDGAATISATTMTMLSDSALQTGTVIWIGSEAIAIDDVTDQTLTVRRGYLGTIATPHDDRSPIYTVCQYITGRRAAVYLVPLSAASESEALKVGEYVIDSVSWDDTTNVWILRGKSQLQYLDALVPRSTQPDVSYEPTFDDLVHWDDSFFRYSTWGGGVSSISRYYSDAAGVHIASGLAYTSDELQATSPASSKTRVMFANGGVSSSFRFSPGPTPSTSRTSGTWTSSDHWLDIILCIMASSSHISDGLELVNYVAAYGNYSALPIGFGVGIPAALIDWASFASVKSRTLEWRFGSFVFGAEPASFGEFITEKFLHPLGAYISYASGQAKIILPRAPNTTDLSISLGPSSLLRRGVSPSGGSILPEFSVKQSTGSHTGSIVYSVNGGTRKIQVDSANFAGTYGQRGVYVSRMKPVVFDLSGLDYDSAGAESSVIELAARRLYRFERPMLEFEATIGMDSWPISPGDSVSVTLDDIPNLSGRGWAAVKAEVIEMELMLSADRDSSGVGATVKIKALTYNEAATHVIAPAAYVASVASNVATVSENRYTTDGAEDHGLPGRDCDAFAVGDIVQLKARDGTPLGTPTTQTQVVSSIGTNTIALDGDFSGSLATGTVLVMARYDVSLQASRDKYAYMADIAEQMIGSSTAMANLYGEM